MSNLDQILSDMPKRCALAELVGFCEGIRKTGVLGDVTSASLRKLLDKAEAAFDPEPVEITPAGLAAMAEYEQANSLELQLQAVHREMGAT